MVAEKEMTAKSGWPMLFVLFAGLWVVLAGYVTAGNLDPRQFPAMPALFAIGSTFLGVAIFIGLFGFFVVSPNEAKVLLLFGDYKGTVKTPGFFYVNPLYSKKRISLRVRNFETGVMETPAIKDAAGHVVQHSTKKRQPSKVNDRDGNPIEIAAVVVWRVVDTAAALFEVDNYEDFVHVQSDSALRNLATRYHYDDEKDEVHSLRGNTSQVAQELQRELAERLSKAGVAVEEARISYLAYASEIAAAMLQRQQATAIIAARQKIVEGAVGMVEMAIDRLEAKKLVDLDPERKAAMVGNLLVVLCSHANPQPVLNTGSLY